MKNISPNLFTNQIMNSSIQKNLECYRFSFGKSPFPVPIEFQNRLQENTFQKRYIATSGLASLKKVISHKYQNAFKSNQIVVGPGTKQLLFKLQLGLALSSSGTILQLNSANSFLTKLVLPYYPPLTLEWMTKS